MSKQTYRVCFCFRRRFKLAVLEAPAEIKSLFKNYSENGIMSVNLLQRFLIEVQKEENATREDAQKIVDSVKHFHFHCTGINLEAFFKYLFGDINPPLSPSLEDKTVSSTEVRLDQASAILPAKRTIPHGSALFLVSTSGAVYRELNGSQAGSGQRYTSRKANNISWECTISGINSDQVAFICFCQDPRVRDTTTEHQQEHP